MTQKTPEQIAEEIMFRIPCEKRYDHNPYTLKYQKEFKLNDSSVRWLALEIAAAITQERKASAAKIGKLKLALEFYSRFEIYNEENGHIPVYWEDLKGKRARAALQELEKEGL